MADTNIEWSEVVWNPSTGCDRVSPGCDHCYALTLAKRLKGMGSAKYQRDGDPRTSGPGFGLTVHPDTLDAPLHWRKPRKVFVNSMSDLFHKDVPDRFIGAVFDRMGAASQHTFQVLTKRHARMRSLLNRWERCATEGCRCPGDGPCSAPADVQHGTWPLPNVHLGVTVENQKWADIRIPALLETPAAVRFISAEPLLGAVDLVRWTVPTWDGTQPSIPGLSWVIVGGESGPGARRMELSWARHLVYECQAAGVAVFVKQLGSHWRLGNDGKGGDLELWPEDLQVREFPAVAS